VKGYRASCDTCGTTAAVKATRVEARRALLGHACLHRCESCGGWFPLLVDDGPLCIACDAVTFPLILPLRRTA
jgi:hypothetical protein